MRKRKVSLKKVVLKEEWSQVIKKVVLKEEWSQVIKKKVVIKEEWSQVIKKKVILKEEWSQAVYLEIIQMRRFQKEKEKRKKDTPFYVHIVKVLCEEEKGFIKKLS
ncbi:MAG: hypothetical protein LGB68_05465 [Sulfurovum sp.]|nr:hypothetical protein [Sulfurovum sp.]